MRLKTAFVHRQVDRWREIVSVRYRRFVSSLSFLLIAVGQRRQLVLPIFFAVGLSLHFFVFQLASLVVLGVLLLKLHSYRFANLVLRAAAWRSG